MKKFFNPLLILAAFLSITACEEEYVPEQELGARPMITVTGDGVFDPANIDEAAVNFELDIAGPAQSATMFLEYYDNSENTTYSRREYRTIQEWPQDITIPASDLISTFPQLENTDDLEVFDQVSISWQFTMENGRVLEDYTTALAAEAISDYNPTFAVICPIDLSPYEGEYLFTDPCQQQLLGPDADETYTVTVEAVGPTTLRFRGFLGFGSGVYFDLDLACGQVIVDNRSVEGLVASYNLDDLGNPATFDPTAPGTFNEIYYDWTDFDDVGPCEVTLEKL